MSTPLVRPKCPRWLGPALVWLLLTLASGCTSSGDVAVELSVTPAPTLASTVESTTATPTTATPMNGNAMGDCPNRPSGSSSADFSDDGTFAVTIESFDLVGMTASIDVVQWLVGQDAVDAYKAETGDDEGPPNDYYVRNDNAQLRTVSVAEAAVVRLVRLSVDGSADVSDGSLAELPDYLVEGFSSTIWWGTFADGIAVELCEQYVP